MTRILQTTFYPPAPTMNHLAPHRVIYDTDPGVDDAMALYYALAHPDIEVVGVTTTFGNVTVEQAACNALYLLAIAGRGQIPVTQGVAAPLVKASEAPPDHIHGADGLGNLPQRVATHNQLDARTSAQFIVDMARQHPGEITVVAVGPLGNLALALAIEPALPQLLRQVIIMGGAVLEPGNVSPVAEANIWNDPHAADIVFTAGFDLTMVGLDETHQVILPVRLFAQIAQHQKHPAPRSRLLCQLLQRPVPACGSNPRLLWPRRAGLCSAHQPRVIQHRNWPRARGGRRPVARPDHAAAQRHRLPAKRLGP